VTSKNSDGEQRRATRNNARRRSSATQDTPAQRSPGTGRAAQWQPCKRLTTTRLLDDPMPWVDPRDIATVATLRLLAGDRTGRQVRAVRGPADLT
jgi:hypothetical protein